MTRIMPPPRWQATQAGKHPTIPALSRLHVLQRRRKPLFRLGQIQNRLRANLHILGFLELSATAEFKPQISPTLQGAQEPTSRRSPCRLRPTASANKNRVPQHLAREDALYVRLRFVHFPPQGTGSDPQWAFLSDIPGTHRCRVW